MDNESNYISILKLAFQNLRSKKIYMEHVYKVI